MSAIADSSNSDTTNDKVTAYHPALAVGLDVGATKIAGGVVGFPAATIHHRRVIPTAAWRDANAVLDDCLVLANELLSMAKARATGANHPVSVCIAVPENVDLEGRVTSTNTLAWRGLPLQEMFDRIAPAVVESDVRAAALAESLWGAGRGCRLFVYLTVGSGISHTLMIDGVAYRGATGNAITSASSPLSTVCTECGLRLEPVLDLIAGGLALPRRYNALGTQAVDSARDVLALAAAGDPAAVDVVRSAGEALGVTAGFLVNVLDPEILVVGGGLGLAGGLYWESFLASTRCHIWSDVNRDLPIVPAALGVDAGLIGAAATAWHRFASPHLPPSDRGFATNAL
ncbi:MAG: ROK family protein [Chloroflexi bacterium]|nr:ROK family protein [Chloroflexota bacterium]